MLKKTGGWRSLRPAPPTLPSEMRCSTPRQSSATRGQVSAGGHQRSPCPCPHPAAAAAPRPAPAPRRRSRYPPAGTSAVQYSTVQYNRAATPTSGGVATNSVSTRLVLSLARAAVTAACREATCSTVSTVSTVQYSRVQSFSTISTVRHRKVKYSTTQYRATVSTVSTVLYSTVQHSTV